jgi:hypothetical protein
MMSDGSAKTTPIGRGQASWLAIVAPPACHAYGHLVIVNHLIGPQMFIYLS